MTSLEAHVSYDVRTRLWMSLDANFWAGGEASVTGVANPATYERSSRLGATASMPVGTHYSIKSSYTEGAYDLTTATAATTGRSSRPGNTLGFSWPRFHWHASTVARFEALDVRATVASSLRVNAEVKVTHPL